MDPQPDGAPAGDGEKVVLTADSMAVQLPPGVRTIELYGEPPEGFCFEISVTIRSMS